MNRIRIEKHKGYNPSSQEYYDIGMGEWRISERPEEVLLTTGASTCIVLAAYNHATKVGLLGHFSNLIDEPRKNDHESFNQAVGSLQSLGDLALTTIWLGGGTPYLSSGKDTVKQDRDQAYKLISQLKLPPDNIKIDWSDPDTAIDAQLDCSEGKLKIHSCKSFSI